METSTHTSTGQTNRSLPVERWPESLDILRHLAAQGEPRSIKQISHDVGAPEISTRNRLARLAALGAVRACKATTIAAMGKQVVCTHYVATSYGRDCAARLAPSPERAKMPFVNSVFALGWALKSNG